MDQEYSVVTGEKKCIFTPKLGSMLQMLSVNNEYNEQIGSSTWSEINQQG